MCRSIYYAHSNGVFAIKAYNAGMLNKMRGLEGKFARQYVNRDVASLLLHVPVT